MSNLLKKTGVLSFVLMFLFAAVSGYAATKEELYDWLDAAKEGQALSADQKTALKNAGLEPWPEIKNIDEVVAGNLQFADSNNPYGPTFDWTNYDISASGTEITGLSDDVVVGPFTLPASYDFLGATYTEFYFSSNGFISFTDPGNSYYSNTTIPNTSNPNSTIAWFWDDLNPSNGGTAYMGSVGSDYVIQVNDYNEYGTVGNNLSAQIILKADGTVLLQYLEFNGTIDVAGETIGIENADGSDGIMASYNTDPASYPYAGLAILFGYDLYPVPDATVTGTVTDFDTGAPLEGVVVDIGGIQATTDATGYYSLLSYTGTFDITATYPMYSDHFTGGVAVTDGLVHDFTMEAYTVYTNWDFETDQGMFEAAPGSEWEWGLADDAYSDLAHSGDNVWGTVLTGNYAAYADYYLTTTRSWIIGNPNAMVSYWHWVYYEGSYDGYNFQVSTDGGMSWTILTPLGGYNYSNLYGLGEPGFSSNSGGWAQVAYDLSGYVGQNVMFRFHHGSDSSYQLYGVMIDDFAFVQELAPTSVEVNVTDPYQGDAPLEGANIGFTNEYGLIYYEQTDVNGQVAIAEFPGGPYVLSADYPEFYPAPYLNEVLLEEGVPFVENIELTYMFGDLVGIVTDDGNPVLPVDATVTLVNQGLTTQTNPETGEFVIEHVVAGQCTLQVEAYGHVTQYLYFEFPGGNVVTDIGTIVMPRIPRELVSGYVTDYTEAQNPIEGVTVRIDGIPGAEAVTDPSGYWEMNDVLIEGEYEFEVTFDPVGANGFHDDLYYEQVFAEVPNLFFFRLFEILPPTSVQAQFVDNVININWLEPENHWVFYGGVIEGADGLPIDLNMRVTSLKKEIEGVIARNNPDELAKIGILQKELNIIQGVLDQPQNNNLDMIWDFNGYRIMVNGEILDVNTVETFWDYIDALEARTYEISIAADYGYGDEYLVWSEPIYIYSVPPMYGINPEPYAWFELRPELEGPGVPILTDGDDVNSGFIPFNDMPFIFFGTEYGEINANSNGFLSFVSSSTGGYSGSIPSTNSPNAVIAPFWEDLHLGTEEADYGVWYYSDYSIGLTVIQWHTHAYSAMENEYSFEVILDHNTNDIVFQWEYALPDWISRGPNAVGIENELGNVAYNINFEDVADNSGYRISPLNAATIASITGRVVDMETGEAIVGAHLVARSEAQTAEGLTNIYGDFALPVMLDESVYEVSIDAEGHIATFIPDIDFSESNEVNLGDVPLDAFGTYSVEFSNGLDEVAFNWIQIHNLPGTQYYTPYGYNASTTMDLSNEYVYFYGQRIQFPRVHSCGYITNEGWGVEPPLDFYNMIDDGLAYAGIYVTPLDYSWREDATILWHYFDDTDLFVVEWYLPHANTAFGDGDPVNFQMHFEGSNAISMHYGDVGNYDPDLSDPVSIGLLDCERQEPVAICNVGDGFHPESGTAVKFNPVRRQLAQLEVHVTETAEGTSVDGLDVSIMTDRGIIGTATTGPDGHVFFANLPIHTNAEYTIVIQQGNYEPFVQDVILTEGPNQVEVQIDPTFMPFGNIFANGYSENSVELWWNQGTFFDSWFLYDPDSEVTGTITPEPTHAIGLNLDQYIIEGSFDIQGVIVEMFSAYRMDTGATLEARLDILDISDINNPFPIYTTYWNPWQGIPEQFEGWDYIPVNLYGLTNTDICIAISTPDAASFDETYSIIGCMPEFFDSGIYIENITDQPICYEGGFEPHIGVEVSVNGQLVYDPRNNLGPRGDLGDAEAGQGQNGPTERVDENGRIIPTFTFGRLSEQYVSNSSKSHFRFAEKAANMEETGTDLFNGTVMYYNIYRDGELLASTPGPETYFTDYEVPENTPFDYVVVPVLDIDGHGSPTEGPASEIVTAMASMPPGPIPWGYSDLVDPVEAPLNVGIQWDDPTWNEIYEPLNDLGSINIFRNGEYLTNVEPGVMFYEDVVPSPGIYVYDLQSVDLVGNTSGLYRTGFVMAGSPDLAFDFEADGGPFTPGGEFEWGQPTFGPQLWEGNTSLWGTHLAGYYSDESLFTLVSPPVHIYNERSFMSFGHYFDFENWYDGGAMFVSTDLGNTWEQIGLNPPEYWPMQNIYWTAFQGAQYNNPLGAYLNDGDPIFSGHLNAYEGNWEEIPLYLGDYAGMDIMVAFIGGSDQVGHMHAGWYIDDIGLWNMDYTQFADVTGTISHMGTPLVDIPVMLTNGTLVFDDITLTDGTFTFTGVPWGDWSIIVDAPGYNYFEGTVNIGETISGDLDITLTMPVLEVDPVSIDMVVYPGFVGQIDVSLINTGDGELQVIPECFEGFEQNINNGNGEVTTSKKSGKNGESNSSSSSTSGELDEIPWLYPLSDMHIIAGDDGNGPYIDISQFNLEIPVDAGMYTDMQATLVFYNNSLNGMVLVPATFHVLPEASERVWEFDSGWNLVSHDLLLPDESLETIFADEIATGNLVMVKNGAGDFMVPEVIDNIGNWNPVEGYWVNVVDPSVVVLNAPQIPDNLPIELGGGWSMVSYLPDFEMPADFALSSLGENLIIAKAGNGSFYLPEFGYNGIGDMMNSYGYQVKLVEPGMLQYPMDGGTVIAGSGMYTPAHVDPQHFILETEESAGNMSVLITGADVNGVEIKPGDEIAVYDPRGNRAGVAVWNERELVGLTIWGDNPDTEEIEGFSDGEELYLKLWMAETDIELAVELDIIQSGNDDGSIYQKDGFIIASLNGDLSSVIPTDYFISQNYPNPFNPLTTINYGLPVDSDVKVEVFNVLGQRIATILDTKQKAGYHHISWNAVNQASGTYFYRIQAESFVQVKKMVLMK